MLTRRLIPSLLLRGGRLVKGVRYTDARDAGSPATTARAHNAQGADEMLLLDVDASREGRGPDLETVRRVAAECFMPLTVGGGIRDVEDARRCMAAGADKLMLTTTALDEPDRLTRLSRVFGSQAIVLGVDVVREGGAARLWDHRSRKTPARQELGAWLREAIERGAGEIRLMAVDREGTRRGLDLDLAREVTEKVSVPVILEGGAGSLEHLDAAYAAGVDAVAVGTMLVFSDNNLVKIQRFLASRGHAMRI